jgi:hypothetical protein
MTFDPPVSRYTYRHHIDGTLPIYLSAHAVVYNPDTCQQETAFANCEKTVPFHQDGGSSTRGRGKPPSSTDTEQGAQ